ncbi:unnamed protein product [Pichia kudriavzevii]
MAQPLNLAHQFLDTNFIESKKYNDFNVLPIISTNPYCESFIDTPPPIAVDYFSYDLTFEQYHSCWKNISNNQFMKPYELSNVDNITRLRVVQQTDDLMMFLPTTSQARLENACWRAWGKKLNHLDELNPREINWFKENDVTVLYGPLIQENRSYEDLRSRKMEPSVSTPSSPSVDWSDNSIDSDSESLLQRRYSFESNSSIPTSVSTASSTPLKGILKKRRNGYHPEKGKQKKKCSFSEELCSVCDIV